MEFPLKRRFLALLLLITSGMVRAADGGPLCSAVFDNGITSHEADAKLSFKEDAQLLNAPVSQLGFEEIKTDKKSSVPSCETVDCSPGGSVGATLNPGPFRETASSVDFDVPDDGSMLDQSQYKDVKVDEGATLNVDPDIDEYFIDQLEVKKNGTLILQPGDYWIDDFKLKSGSKLIVAGSGTVRLFVTKAEVEKDVLVNSPAPGVAGDPSKLFLYAYDDDVKLKKDSTFSGFIYSEKKVELEKRAALFGALSAGEEVKLDENALVRLDPAARDSADFDGLCTNAPPVSSAARFEILHDGNGIFCLAEVVTVRVLDAAGLLLTEFEGTVSLSTDTGSGDFALVSGTGGFSNLSSGSASYGFVTADEGTASFALSYSSGPAVVDLDVRLASDSSIADDDSEGPLQFAPSGLTVSGAALGNPPVDPALRPVPPQIAGAEFNVYLTAYGVTDDDPVCGVIETYEGARNLRFWSDHVNPGSGVVTVAVDATVSGTSAATATPQTVEFTEGAAVIAGRYADAGAIRLNVSDGGSAAGPIAGASNAFTVRPAALEITRVEDLAGRENPAAGSMGGDRFVAAGEPFRVIVTAVAAGGTVTPNFGLEASAEGVRVRSRALLAPVGGRNGSAGDVDGGSSFTRTGPGQFTSSTLRFDEVGIIELEAALLDGDYLGAGAVPGLPSGAVGRFSPAGFVMTTSSVTPACNGFSYQGEPALGFSYRIEARNATGAVVANYDTALIGLASVAAVTRVAENADDGIDLSGRLSTSVPLWENGVLTDSTSTAVFSRLAFADGPYDALQLGARLVDTLDGIELTGLDMAQGSAGDCTVTGPCTARTVGTPTRVRYGRLAVLPGIAPEDRDLAVPLQAQYFDGTAFRANDLDRCSRYVAAAATLDNYQQALTAGETTLTAPAAAAVLVDGGDDPAAPLVLSAPGLGNEGRVDLTLDVPGWLEFDWFGTGTTDPTGPQTFGSYRGNDRLVYWEEVDP